jgi:Major Facilitator Superfamily
VQSVRSNDARSDDQLGTGIPSGGSTYSRVNRLDRRGGALLWGTGRHRERPATFREVLGTGEFRAIYGAATLSWIGDSAARAAVTALVFQVTDSAAASAGAFALTYAPWLLGSSILVSLAERYPHRTVMVIGDVARLVIMATVAIPGIPLPLVLVLVLAAAFFAPPFDAARSACLPAVLGGDRYVLGLALFSATSQPAQVVGYLIGAALSFSEPRLAFGVNAVTFAVSAVVVRLGVHWREPALSHARRTRLLQETSDGFRVVFGNPALRSIALLIFGGVLFVVVPEGLGAAWAATLADGQGRGWVQGVIMAAVPFGSILGSLSITRLVRPDVRVQLMRPLAVLVPLTLVPAVFAPSTTVVVILAGGCGFAMGALGPVANGQFVQRVPNEFRARAFGVVQAGVQLLQGAAVLVTGALAEKVPVPMVVGLWSLAGLGLMLFIVLREPGRLGRRFEFGRVAPERPEPAPGPTGRPESEWPEPERLAPGRPEAGPAPFRPDPTAGPIDPGTAGRIPRHAAPAPPEAPPHPALDHPTGAHAATPYPSYQPGPQPDGIPPATPLAAGQYPSWPDEPSWVQPYPDQPTPPGPPNPYAPNPDAPTNGHAPNGSAPSGLPLFDAARSALFGGASYQAAPLPTWAYPPSFQPTERRPDALYPGSVPAPPPVPQQQRPEDGYPGSPRGRLASAMQSMRAVTGAVRRRATAEPPGTMEP